MKIVILDEPQLEFAGGSRHIDPRSGITNYGPADAPTRTRGQYEQRSSVPKSNRGRPELAGPVS
jgi:hypothetical protein